MSDPSPGGQDADRPAAPPPLSAVIPPIILGTATFNTQYVTHPSEMPSTQIVARALSLGIRAFDTSPYYGPSELLLGQALASAAPPRDSYLLITKAGRLGPSTFDYTRAGIRRSVASSLRRLGVSRLDLVYCHDAEFVSPAAVLEAVSALRELRAEGTIRYVGISGYPLPVLTSLARLVLDSSGEPLDAVLSYSHFTLQNTALADDHRTLDAFRRARVDVVLNASVLGMGLLTSRGVDAAPMAKWHPAPRELRTACSGLRPLAEEEGMGLEEAAIRFALGGWAEAAGEDFGTEVGVRAGAGAGGRKTGVSVLGVSSVAELEETWRVWQEIVSELGPEGPAGPASKVAAVRRLAREKIWPALGAWKDYTWASPGEDYVPAEPSSRSKI